MKGEWKNNVAGWNAKDTKRKKQTHNHRLRDNARVLYNKYGSFNSILTAEDDVFRSEGVFEIVYTGNRYRSDEIFWESEIFNVQVEFNKRDENGNFIVDYIGSYNRAVYIKEYRYIKAYKDLNENEYGYSNWKTVDNINIYEFFGLEENWKTQLSVTIMHKTNSFAKLNTEKAIENKNKVHVSTIEYGEDFMYNKPLPSWKIGTYYGDGQRRKFGQKIANKADRAALRNWICKKDISLEIKTHALSKSIAWYIN